MADLPCLRARYGHSCVVAESRKAIVDVRELDFERVMQSVSARAALHPLRKQIHHDCIMHVMRNVCGDGDA